MGRRWLDPSSVGLIEVRPGVQFPGRGEYVAALRQMTLHSLTIYIPVIRSSDESLIESMHASLSPMILARTGLSRLVGAMPIAAERSEPVCCRLKCWFFATKIAGLISLNDFFAAGMQHYFQSFTFSAAGL